MLFAERTSHKTMDMAQAKKELAQDASIYLLDVRTGEEYRAGHIPGSHNISLDQLRDILSQLPQKDARLFVYCLSGARSRAAATQLTRMGYTDVTNIGGIAQWKGQIERKVSV